jgi:hypothetical protein
MRIMAPILWAPMIWYDENLRDLEEFCAKGEKKKKKKRSTKAFV